MMQGYSWFGNGFCGYGAGYFSIWHIFIWIGIILVVAAMVIYFSKRNRGIDPLEELKMLYVNGKISEEEYLNRKQIIERK